MASTVNLEIKITPSFDVSRVNAFLSSLKNSLGELGTGITPINAESLNKGLKNVKDDLNGVSEETKKSASEINQLNEVYHKLSSIVSEASAPFISYQKGLAELSSITGVSGDALDNLGGKARDLALKFGGNATDGLESFKGILSRLGPDIAKSPEALGAMADAVGTLSAATGDSAVASMDALTTGMLQFGVDLSDPIEASKVMTSQMNVMAAGAKEGASEVPQIADALKVAGVAASQGKVSFEETNAALQALAAGGKVGSEAGTALRNVMTKLGEGRFLPADVQSEFAKAGVSISRLGDTSLSLTDRLRELQKIQGDAALMSKFFGAENSAAGSILLRSVDNIDVLKEKITGTSTAFEQAAINQDTIASSMERAAAQMADIGISVGETLGSAIVGGVQVAGNIAPTLQSLVSVKDLLPASLQEQVSKSLGSIFSGGLSGVLPALSGFGSKAMAAISGLVPALGSVGGAAGATGGAFSTMWALATGPVGLTIAAIAAVSAALYAFFNFTETGKQAWETLTGYVSAFIDNAGSILKAGGELFSTLLNPLSWFNGDATEAANKVAGVIEDTLTQGAANADANKAALAMQKALDGLPAAVDTATKGKIKLDKAVELDGLVAKLQEAKTEAEKNSIAEAIAKQAPEAVAGVKTIIDAEGNAQTVYDISVTKARELVKARKDAGTGEVKASQTDIIKGLQAEAEQYEANKKKLAELNTKREEQKIAGIDTAELDKQLEDMQKTVSDSKSKLTADLSQATKLGIFDNLPAEAQAAFNELKSKQGSALLEAQQQITAANLGKTLAESAKLKGDIDASAGLKKLVEDFKNAGSEAEKNSIAEKIQQQVPGAITGIKQIVDANGNIKTSLQVNTNAVLDYANSQEKATGTKAVKNAQDYKNQLAQQADQYNALKTQANELAQKIIEGNKAGKDTTELKSKYQELTGKINETGNAIADNIKKGKEYGIIKGDVNAVGKEFKYTAQQADAVAEAALRIKDSVEQAKQSAAELGAALKKSLSEMQSTGLNTAAGIVSLRKQLTDLSKEEANARKLGDAERVKSIQQQKKDIQNQINEEIKLQREKAKQYKNDQQAIENAEIETGWKDKQVEKEKEKGKSTEKNQETEFQKAKALFELYKSQEEAKLKADKAERDRVILQSQKPRTKADDLIDAKAELELKEKLKVKASELFKVSQDLNEQELQKWATRKSDYESEVKYLQSIIKNKKDLSIGTIQTVKAKYDIEISKTLTTEQKNNLTAKLNEVKSNLDKVKKNVDVGINLQKSEGNELSKLLEQIGADLAQDKNKVLQAALNLIPRVDEDKLKDVQEKEYEANLKLGIVSSTDVIGFYASRIGDIGNEIKSLQDQQLEFINKAFEENAITQEQKLQAEKSVINLQTEGLQSLSLKRKEYYAKIDRIRQESNEKEYKEKLDLLNELQKEEEDRLKKKIELNKRYEDTVLLTLDKIRKAQIDAFKTDEIKKLEQQYQVGLLGVDKYKKIEIEKQRALLAQGLINEKEYQEKVNAIKNTDSAISKDRLEEEKARIEKEAKQRELVDSQRNAAAKLALEYKNGIDAYQLKAKHLQEMLALEEAALSKNPDDKTKQDKVDNLKKELKASQEAYKGFQDSIVKYGEGFGEAMNFITTSAIDQAAEFGAALGSGDIGGIQDGMQKFLVTVVGGLEKMLSALISKWVIEDLLKTSGLGILGLFLEPLIRGAITAGVRGIFNPVFSFITSPTGGVFDKPTLTVVGDGSRLGGPDREYVLRDEHIRSMLKEATNGQGAVVDAINSLSNKFDNMLLKFELKGNSLKAVLDRVNSDEKSREVDIFG